MISQIYSYKIFFPSNLGYPLHLLNPWLIMMLEKILQLVMICGTNNLMASHILIVMKLKIIHSTNPQRKILGPMLSFTCH